MSTSEKYMKAYIFNHFTSIIFFLTEEKKKYNFEMTVV